MARIWRWARTPAKALGLLSATATSIAAGHAVAGVIGALAAGVLVVCAARLVIVAIPVIGFTRSQTALVEKGREYVTSVADACIMMERHADAYDVILRRLPTGPLHGDLRALPQAGVIDGPGEVRAREQAWPAPEMALSRSAGPGREMSPGRGGRHLPQSGVTGAAPARGPGNHRSTPTFWQLLTLSEQQALTAAARMMTFGAGTFVCRQGQPAEHIIIIKSGWTRVYTEDPDGSRVIAERGPGDLIGERAVMMVRWRSASVVALETVHAFVISDQDFSKFLHAHPRANALLENQVYQRLTESHSMSDPAAPAPDWTGQMCPIVLTDITAFASPERIDEDRAALRRHLYEMIPKAFETADLPWQECYREDRGDGTLIIVPPHVPAHLFVDHALDHLATSLRRHNQEASDALRMQLRVALHAGPVTHDPNGMVGNAINHTARLVQARVLQKRLKTTQADLAVIASEFLYDNVIKQHGRQSLDPRDYQKVRFRTKESTITGWIHLSGIRHSGLCRHVRYRTTRQNGWPAGSR